MEKCFLFPNQSYNCSVHCAVVSVCVPIVLHDGEYSNEMKTVIDLTLKFPLPLSWRDCTEGYFVAHVRCDLCCLPCTHIQLGCPKQKFLVIRIGLKRGRQHCTRTRLVLLWHVHESRTSVSVRVFRKKDHYFHPSRYLLELHPIIQNALVSVFKSCDGEIYLKPRPDWSPLGVRPLRLIGYWLVALEGEGSNCFSITQLVRQKRQ